MIINTDHILTVEKIESLSSKPALKITFLYGTQKTIEYRTKALRDRDYNILEDKIGF